ncbi:MAG: F0F1 ATP synthase subunit A [Firmicutes bacterium]|nr:F0F1 ATP synthase subunit A [Bacillota bacterium]
MEFSNSFIAPLFTIGGVTFYLTKTLLSTWFVMLALIIFAVVVRVRLRSFVDAPKAKSLQNAVEAMVETMSNFARDSLGQELEFLGPYFFGVFAFILVSNLTGLLGFRPPTADLAVTLGLGLSSFFLIHVLAIVRKRGRYFKEYLEPIPVFLPINLIGELALPVSLSFRLFGNLLGGIIIMGLIYGMFPVFLKIGVPAVLHIYFDVFVGCLQAFVFTVLSMTFLHQKAGREEL